MKQDNKTSLSDIPFKESVNDFGTERYVNGLIKFIENSAAPITIALQGEWGSGKTSLMTRLERALCSKANAPFIGVNINTWEYSMMSSPEMTVYKILARLVRELTGENTDSKKKVSKIMRALYRGGREALKMIPGMNIAVEMANLRTDLPGDDKEPDTDSDASLSELRDELQRVINNRLTESGQRGVIVFVDDLDRLNPPVAVEILELLKNVFTLDNCIFVLAIDYDVVVKGLEPKFGKLTDKNEREFRSFFDKIIQVPFSLPVSSYRPMDFVLNALVGIGYLTSIEAGNPEVMTRFSSVVEYTVGKNPRSIKRLINTLSLLDCIDQCGSDLKKDESSAECVMLNNPIDEKLLNLIIVAIQISYPKIYRMLVHQPTFTTWDHEFAIKEGITIGGNESDTMEWDDILEASYSTDKYLTQHASDLRRLFDMMISIMDNHNMTDQIGQKLKQIIDKSAITGVGSGSNAEEFDPKTIIAKLHANIANRLQKIRPDITRFKLKGNTGRGGIHVWYDDNSRFTVSFAPAINSKNKVELEIRLDLQVARPQRMKVMSIDQILEDKGLLSSLNALDSILSQLLKSCYYFKGRETYKGQNSKFSSYIDELRHIHKMGWMTGDITNNPQYWIELANPTQFEDPEIVETVTKLIIANYDFRKSMKNWR